LGLAPRVSHTTIDFALIAPLKGWILMLLVQLAQHATLIADTAQHVHTTLSTLAVHQSAADPAAPTNQDGNVLPQLYNFVILVRQVVTELGLIIFGIGIAIAGIMRMVSMGNERRVAMSNMALTAAVIGLVIVLLSNGLLTFLQGAFK
jgi:hypothetical protein